MMYGHFIVGFVTLMCLQSSRCAGTLDSEHNVFCKLIDTAVRVNGTGLPYFVMLKQCQGSVGHRHPDQKECVARTWTDVDVVVASPGKRKVTVKNHTSCTGKCVRNAKLCPEDRFNQDSDTCVCTCKHKARNCSDNHRWNNADHVCACECHLGPKDETLKKKLDENKCQLVCRDEHPCPGALTWDSNKCRCVIGLAAVAGGADSDNTRQEKILAAVVIGEFFFLCFIFDLYLYSKNMGLMYNLKGKCRPRSKSQSAASQDQRETKRCLENGHDTNSVPMQGVVVDKNGCAHVAPSACQHVSST